MIPELLKKEYRNIGELMTGPYRVLILLFITAASHVTHVLMYPFPKRDPLLYLSALHYWNMTGSYTLVLEKYSKFSFFLFTFLPLKWGEQIGLPLYPASVVWMILMSMVSVYALYKIVLLLTGDAAKAMWCGVFLAVQPMILLYAGNLLRDTPYLMFCLLSALCFICAVRNRKWYLFLSTGITLAMCALSRIESWEMLAFFPVFSLFCFWKKNFGKKDILFWILFSAAGFLCTIVLMLCAIDDLDLLFDKGKIVFFSYFPQWMRW